jgi:hypothetical protein
MDPERDELALAASMTSPISDSDEAWREAGDAAAQAPDSEDRDLRLARWLKSVDR